MSVDVNKLIGLKKKIEESKSEKDKAQGALLELEKRLKSEFSLDSVEAGEARITELQAEIADLETSIQAKMKDLEERYEL